MTKIVDGKKIAEEIFENLRPRIKKLKKKGIVPTLSVVLVGKNELLKTFANIKERTLKGLGLCFKLFYFEIATESEVCAKISELNREKNINGIVSQLPMPSNIRTDKVLRNISPKKDVDRLNQASKRRVSGFDLRSPIVKATFKILQEMKINLSLNKFVIMGAGRLVGKPLKEEFKKKSIRYEVVDKETKDRTEKIKKGDVIICGVGEPGLLTCSDLKENASVIDAGTCLREKRFVGDFKMDSKKPLCFVAPVPGGIGPVMVAYLVENLVILTELTLKDKKV